MNKNKKIKDSHITFLKFAFQYPSTQQQSYHHHEQTPKSVEWLNIIKKIWSYKKQKLKLTKIDLAGEITWVAMSATASV